MKNLKTYFIISILVILIATSLCCSQGEGGSNKAHTMPYLPDGQHLSWIKGFEVLPAPIETEAATGKADAIAAGMDVGRIQLDWADLETGPGVYDQTPLTDALAALKADGLKPFVGIYAIDSSGPVVPADLADDATPTGLTGGISINDSTVIARYKAVLDWAVPLIVSEGGWILSVANEPDAYMEDNPSESPKCVEFYREAIKHSHSIDPDLAVSVTLTASPIDTKKFFFDDVMILCDVAVYNYYPLQIVTDDDWTTYRFALRTPLSTVVPSDLDKLIDAAMGKQIIFQELGCPAGYDSSSVIQSTEAQQEEFFTIVFTRMISEPRIRAIFEFTLVDWSSALVDIDSQPLVDEGVDSTFIDSYREWLMTGGMIRYDTGVQRPSWAVFINTLNSL